MKATDSAAAELPGRIDPAQWPELSFRLGLTDGLPTFPPERERVNRLVEAVGGHHDEIRGTLPPSGRTATLGALAANAVMAGCAPEHFPVVLAALDAVLEPEFNLAGVVTTTHPCWPLVLVAGEAVDGLGMVTGESVFSGGGARANVVIGRALSLILWNLGGARPGQPVQEIFGHPGRLAYCLAEAERGVDWAPRYAGPGTRVTVFACEGPQVVNLWGVSTTGNPHVPDQWMDLVAEQMGSRGNSNTHTMGEVLVVISPAMVRSLAAFGWSRDDVREALWRRARRRLGDIRLEPDGSAAVGPRARYTWWPQWVDQDDPDAMVPVVADASAIHVVVAGGDTIPAAAVCPGWGHLGGFAVSRWL